VFTEVLRIKPVLDKGASAVMEQSLSARFSRVAKRFGVGLKSIVKGTAFGIGLSLLAQLLNPLENLEKRIKELLEEGGDLGDLADRLHTGTGQLKQTEVLAQSVGLKKEDFKSMVEAFAKAVETARTEAATPQGIQSENATVVQKFLGEKDLLQGFYGFITALKTASPEVRRKSENAVFGEQQFGASRRFIELDQEKQSAKLGLADTMTFGAASRKVTELARMQAALEAKNQANDFILSAEKMSGDTIRRLEAKDERERADTRKQFDNFSILTDAAANLAMLTGMLRTIQTGVLQLLNIITKLAGGKAARGLTDKEEK
jgi:hypothetical protein